MAATPRYQVDRQIYSIEELSHDYIEDEIKFDILKKLDYRKRIRQFSILSALKSIFPFPFIMASFYSYKYLIYDIIAGITLLVTHIPQGMAYGLLSGLQPINGLYTSFFAPLVYAFFGTSHHLSVGTFSIMSLISSVPVYREAKMPIIKNHTSNGTLMDPMIEYEKAKLQISISTTLLASIIQLLLGFLRLGWVMNYINDALVSGFATATAFHVMLSQFDAIFGYSIEKYSGLGELPYKLYLYAIAIPKFNWITVGISCTCMLILVFFVEIVGPRFKKISNIPLPIPLVLITVGTLLSYFGSFQKKYHVTIVDNVPKGLPAPMIPDVTNWENVFLDAILVAIFGFILSSALVKIYATKYSYDVDYNQEFIAYGLSNVVSSFFQCTASSGAIGRSSVAIEAGMISQVSCLISCVGLLFVLLFLGALFEPLPLCVLSSIIIVSLKSSIFQFKEVRELYKVSKCDFAIWIVSFTAIIVLNVPYGLITGFLFSLLTVYLRFHNPKSQILGQLPDTNIYRDIKTFKEAVEIPGIKIFRYETPIYFGNIDSFKMKLFRKSKVDLKRLLSEKLKIEDEATSDKKGLLDKKNDTKIEQYGQDVKFLIIDFSSVNYIDNDATRILMDIFKSCREVDIWVFFAEPNLKIRKMLTESGIGEDKLQRLIFVSVHDAVLRASSIMMKTDEI